MITMNSLSLIGLTYRVLITRFALAWDTWAMAVPTPLQSCSRTCSEDERLEAHELHTMTGDSGLA